jgi:citrate synthase
MSYDPAFLNAASRQSRITLLTASAESYAIAGIPSSNQPSAAPYLLVCGELPDTGQLREWVSAITHHTMIPGSMTFLASG